MSDTVRLSVPRDFTIFSRPVLHWTLKSTYAKWFEERRHLPPKIELGNYPTRYITLPLDLAVEFALEWL